MAVEYNCIAWAAGEVDRWWWPDSMGQHYWPPSAPRQETLDAFVAAFSTLGYQVCSDATIESGFEKVAIYSNGEKPTHAARQARDGSWLSKLGPNVDITHTLDGLVGGVYGNLACFLKRPTPSTFFEPPPKGDPIPARFVELIRRLWRRN
jgi:hypothetical protein